LALEKNARVSTLAAWCEARGDFRSFRVDRIVAVNPTGETFADEPGRRLADYRARVDAEANPAANVTPPRT
jgi:predicted DNA-binding transcriptional regulator YafY